MIRSNHTSTSNQEDDSTVRQYSNRSYCLDVIFTLEHIAYVKIATAFWSSQKMGQMVKSKFINCQIIFEYWSSNCEKLRYINRCLIGHEMEEALFSLPLPESCKKKLLPYVKAVLVELLNWIRYQDENIFAIFSENKNQLKAYNFINHVTWTKRGTVDCERTARSLLNDAALSHEERFAVACTYCLEDGVYNIVQSVANAQFVEKIDFVENPLLYYWYRRFLLEKMGKPFVNPSVNLGINVWKLPWNTRAVKLIDKTNHFWNGCPPSFRNKAIRKCLYECDSEIQRAVLSHVYIPGIFLKTCLGKILSNFLNNVLWEDYFIPNLCLYWNEISYEQFEIMLETLLTKIESSEDDTLYYKYVDIFEQMWYFMPKNFKHFIISGVGLSLNALKKILRVFRLDQHFDIIRTLFSNKIAFYDCEIMSLCSELLNRRRVQYFEIFVNFFFPNERDLNRFKKLLLYSDYQSSIYHNIMIELERGDLIVLNVLLKWFLSLNDEGIKIKELMFIGLVYIMARPTQHDTLRMHFIKFKNLLKWYFQSEARLNDDTTCAFMDDIIAKKNEVFQLIANPSVLNCVEKWFDRIEEEWSIEHLRKIFL